MDAATARIGIVEDDADLRGSLVETIGDDPGLEVVFAAGSAAEARREIRRAAIDLCLVDIGLPDGSGLELLADLRAAGNARSLILTVLGDRTSVLLALHAGADGYLLKDTTPNQLRRCIHLTLAGETPLSPQAATYLLDIWRTSIAEPEPAAAGDVEALTPREVEVLKLFSRGLSYREAADVLNISPHTIGDHVKSIHQKLQVHSRAEALFEARQLGLISSRD